MVTNYSIFTKLFLLCLIVTTYTQNIVNFTSFCQTVSTNLNPVCHKGVRYWNLQMAQCKTNQTTLQTQACNDKKYQKTVIQSGHECNCPLVQKATCMKKGNEIHYNPCFANCVMKNTGYGDYKYCPENSAIWGSRSVGTTIYKNDLTCNCPTQYQPICIDHNQYSNACFAQCYQPNTPTQTCVSKFNYVTLSANQNNCVCVHTVNPVCIDGKRYGNACLANCDHPNKTFYPC